MKEKEKEKTPIKNMENISSFSLEEKKLLKKYMDEYNDMYQKILILSQDEFIEKLKKHIELSLRSKIKKYSEKSKTKVQEFLIEKIYQSDYKYAQIIQKNIENRNRFEISKNYFKGEIIPHCDKDKKNGYYIHSCGEKFQTFKYKLSYDYYILHLDKDSKSKDINTNHYENILFCRKCKMIYKSSLIKFKCAETSVDFYSKINLSYLDNEDLPFATWAKYHCNVVINDLMKCQKCSNNLYLLRKKIKNNDKKYVFCKKCNQIWLPEQLKWECLLCKNKFSCDAKVYNPLEYKTIKICVKDALVDKIKAYPKYLDCKCKIDYSKTNFFHRTSCYGELFFGELNNKKTVICSKCDSIGFYDEYVWTCPICFKKTKTEKIIENEEKSENLKNSENKSAIHGRDNKKKENFIDEEKSKNKEKVKDKDSVSVSKITNDKSMRQKKLFNLFQNIKKLNEDDKDIIDLKNNFKTNNYIRNKSINNFLFKEKDKKKEKEKNENNENNENYSSVEKRKINNSIKDSEKSGCKTIEKDISDIENENENINSNNEKKVNFNLNKNSEYSRNNKEEYFRNYKKKYVTNISIKTKIKTDYNNNDNEHKDNNNDNLSSNKIINNNSKNILSANRYSGKKDVNKNLTKDKIINTEENRVLKPKKSLSIIDFGYSNIKDIESILNKFEKKININLNYKPMGATGMNFHRPLSKQIVNNKQYSTIENKDKDIFVSKNKTAIDDLKTEESPITNRNEIFGEKITRKESFMSKYNKLKNSKNYSRINSNKNLLSDNENNISQNKNNINNNDNNINKNLLLKSVNVNVDYFKTEINKNKNEGKNDENNSYIKKSKIFQRYRNLKNNNYKNENKSMQRIKINNDLINKNNNDDKDEKDEKDVNKNNRKDSINDKYYIENYNNKKGSNSTADDSDQTTKIIYHAKNPRQSFQIRKSNTNVNKYFNNFNINDYTIIKKIGQGSFGQIFLIEDKYKNKFAMKKIIAIAEKDIKKIEHEYQILIDLSKQNEKVNNAILNLVKIYGYSSKQLDPTTYVIYVLMELALTDWEKEILSRQKRREYYTEKELMTILYSLINTFAELQKKNISHRDIKPQNILLFKDNKYKLADFGEAKELYKDLAPTNKQTLRGTELYMAPTLFQALQSKKIIKYINHNPYKSDVFSFGLCSLLAASLCFESIYDIRELNNNVSIRVILEKYLHKNYSFDVINIISQMLDINETTRKDFIEMKNEFETIGYK